VRAVGAAACGEAVRSGTDGVRGARNSASVVAVQPHACGDAARVREGKRQVMSEKRGNRVRAGGRRGRRAAVQA